MNNDMRETKIIVRCAICQRVEEERKAIHAGWRTYPMSVGEPVWICPDELARNIAETHHRVALLSAQRVQRTQPLSLQEWLDIFCNGDTA
jgi:uncharacterized protein YlaI